MYKFLLYCIISLLREKDDKRAETLQKCSQVAILNFHEKILNQTSVNLIHRSLLSSEELDALFIIIVPREQNQILFSLRTM